MSEDLDDFLTRPDLSCAGPGGLRRPSNRRFRSDCRRNCRCSLLGGSTGPPQRLQATPGAVPGGHRQAWSSFRPAKRASWAAESVRGMPTKAPGDLQKPRKRCTVDDFRSVGQTRVRCRQERSNSRSGGAETCPGAAQEPSESVQGGGQGHPGRPRSGPRGAGSGQKPARKR